MSRIIKIGPNGTESEWEEERNLKRELASFELQETHTVTATIVITSTFEGCTAEQAVEQMTSFVLGTYKDAPGFDYIVGLEPYKDEDIKQ